MNSREAEHSHWGRHGDRGVRQWDYANKDWKEDEWKDKQGHDRDKLCSEEADVTRGTWKYGDSPGGSYSKETLDRDWRDSHAGKVSPAGTPPDQDLDLRKEYESLEEEDKELLRKKRELQLIEEQIANKKATLAMKHAPTRSDTSLKPSFFDKQGQRCTEDNENVFDYRQAPHDFQHRHNPPDEDFKYRPSQNSFRHRQPPEEYPPYRRSSREYDRSRSPEEDPRYRRSPREYDRRRPPRECDRSRSPEEDHRYRRSPREHDRRRSLEEDSRYRRSPREYDRWRSPREYDRSRSPEDDYRYRRSPREYDWRRSPREYDRSPSPREYDRRRSAEDNTRYRRSSREYDRSRSPEEDSRYRRSPTEFKYRRSPDEDSKYRRSPTEFNRRHLSRESTHWAMPRDLKYKQQPEDYLNRQPFVKDDLIGRGKNDNSQERTDVEEFFSKVLSKCREQSNHQYPSFDDHHLIRMNSPANEVPEQSNGQRETKASTPGSSCSQGTDDPNKIDKGFQRFLNVLNKGVDFSRLSKIVCQPSEKGGDPTHGQTSLQETMDPQWASSKAQQGTPYRSENQTSTRDATLEKSIDVAIGRRKQTLPGPRGYPTGPEERPQSYKKYLPGTEAGVRYLSSSSSSRSPPMVEEANVKPDDKCRQMQDVLQAIGVDLGLEELGLMSNRIRERLYGKKDDDRTERDRERRRRVYSPRRHSRSSSSDSSDFEHPPQKIPQRRGAWDVPQDVKVNKIPERGYPLGKSSREAMKDDKKDGRISLPITAAPQASVFSTSTYHLVPPPLRILPSPQVPLSLPPPPPLPPPPQLPQLPNQQIPPPSQLPPPLPFPPPIIPPNPNGHYYPYYPYYQARPVAFPPGSLSYPPFPAPPAPMSYPSSSTQKSAHSQPSRQLTYVNLQGEKQDKSVNAPVNFSQTLSRPRCLQVIDTSQPQTTSTTVEESQEKKSVEKSKKTVVQKKPCLQSVPFSQLTKPQQNKLRKRLYYSGHLKVFAQRQKDRALKTATEKSITKLLKLARLKAAKKPAAGSLSKHLTKGRKKKTIKLKLLVDKVIVNSSASTEETSDRVEEKSEALR